ncbi:MAG: CDP-alcohol phosphatidyltransferase family protein, partial [Paludibacteraceae bacterium]|nr:CDP-alcohol phosphatidyltransferase family protein [Paludibacteraceae bacterium]
MKKYIPNLITCSNLFSGCVATYFAFNGHLYPDNIAYLGALMFVLLAAVFDFFDGFAARALHSYSPLGKELDSLADMVSFGFVPGALVFDFLRYNIQTGSAPVDAFLPFVGFIITIGSALRLAKFNIDERQSSSFIGLPTPANALFWTGLMASYAPMLERYAVAPWIIMCMAFLMSIMLVAEIPMFSLKFHNYAVRDNIERYIFLTGCIVLLAVWSWHAFAWIILWYILFNFIWLI